MLRSLVGSEMCIRDSTHTHTHTHTFNGPLSRTTQVSRYQKSKTNLDFTEATDSEWQWHQPGHTQVCTSFQTDIHASTPPLSFFTGQMPFLPPNQQRQSTEGKLLCLQQRVINDRQQTDDEGQRCLFNRGNKSCKITRQLLGNIGKTTVLNNTGTVHIASAAVAVDSSHMTASSSSASWSIDSVHLQMLLLGTCRQRGSWSVAGHYHYR